MTDTTTQKPLRVNKYGGIQLPFSQLEEVKSVLDSNGIRYWVAQSAVSVNGGPYTIDIDLAEGTDRALVQSLLDKVA